MLVYLDKVVQHDTPHFNDQDKSKKIAMNPVEHLKLCPQCGICADSIQRDEIVVALYQKSNNPASYNCSPPFNFPSREMLATFVVSHTAVDIAFCDYDECDECAISLEAAAVHQSCYKIFVQGSHVSDMQYLLRRLLLFTTWRRPWREAQPLYLPSRVDKQTLDAVAGLFGMPQLCGLPVELLEMIRALSAHSLLWRNISALRMATYVSDTRTEPQQSRFVALRNVVSWERGRKLEVDMSEFPTLPPIIRLTMDSDGISKVERLPSHPKYSRGNYTHTAYIVGSENDEGLSDGAEVEVADRHLRLILPPTGQVPHIWNTPYPPMLSSCRMSPYDPSATWSRLFAFESDNITGITFFHDQGRLCDIHIHYPEGPSAQWTYYQMKRAAQRNAMWLYLPIPKGDRLTIMGARQQNDLPPCHLFRFEKSGDVIIGAHGSSLRDDCLGKGAPLAFIYGEPNRADLVPWIELVGAYSGMESLPSRDLCLPKDFPLDKYEPSPITEGAFLQAEYFSWAPLEDIASTVVFRDRVTGRCKGILFHYANGGSRAVGECRLHVDPAEKVDGPSSICVKIESRPSNWNRNLLLYRTRVKFRQHSPQHEHHHEDEAEYTEYGWSIDTKWECHTLRGYAKFWFTAEASFLSVTTGLPKAAGAQELDDSQSI